MKQRKEGEELSMEERKLLYLYSISLPYKSMVSFGYNQPSQGKNGYT